MEAYQTVCKHCWAQNHGPGLCWQCGNRLATPESVPAGDGSLDPLARRIAALKRRSDEAKAVYFDAMYKHKPVKTLLALMAEAQRCDRDYEAARDSSSAKLTCSEPDTGGN